MVLSRSSAQSVAAGLSPIWLADRRAQVHGKATEPVPTACPNILPPELTAILAHERGIWDALASGDSKSDHELLDERFLGVYSTGFANRDEHVDQLRSGPCISEFCLHEARMLIVKPDVIVLAYMVTFRRTGARLNDPPERMYVSSLRQAGTDGWRNVFSQDTGAA